MNDCEMFLAVGCIWIEDTDNLAILPSNTTEAKTNYLYSQTLRSKMLLKGVVVAVVVFLMML